MGGFMTEGFRRGGRSQALLSLASNHPRLDTGLSEQAGLSLGDRK